MSWKHFTQKQPWHWKCFILFWTRVSTMLLSNSMYKVVNEHKRVWKFLFPTVQLRLTHTNRKRLYCERDNLQFDQSHFESVSETTLYYSRFRKNFPTTRQLTALLCIEPHREETSKLTHKIEKSQSNYKVCAPVEDSGDGDGATTNVRRIELTEYQPCHYNTE